MKRIRVVTGSTVLFAAVAAVSLTGCSTLSPATVSDPYPPSDGVGKALPGTDVVLRNFLVIGTAKNAPASVIGTIANDGPNVIQVSLQTDLGGTSQPKQTVVSVGPSSSVQIGPNQPDSLVIADLAVAPGAFTTISAATLTGGSTQIDVPVLLPTLEYTGLTPSPVPTPTATPTDTPSPSDAISATTTSSKKAKKGAAGAPSPTAG